MSPGAHVRDFIWGKYLEVELLSCGVVTRLWKIIYTPTNNMLRLSAVPKLTSSLFPFAASRLPWGKAGPEKLRTIS